MTTMFGAAYADGREKPTSVDKLPQAAQEFLSAHFKGSHGGICRRGAEIHGQKSTRWSTPTVRRSNSAATGSGESVGRKYSPVPASIVRSLSKPSFPEATIGQFIRQIDRNAYTWEVELSNGLEIKFDNQFNVIDIDD